MNSIFIHDLRVETKIGVYEWERHRRRRSASTSKSTAVGAPIHVGRLRRRRRHAAVVERIKALAASNPHPLVERFAESIAQLVLDEFGAPSVKVRVAKLAPLPGVRELGVQIERQRVGS
jgi:dihydroneopterin aldolase